MAKAGPGPVPVPSSRRTRTYTRTRNGVAYAGCPVSQTPITTSITKQMAAMGVGSPQDLLSTMVMDHERVVRKPMPPSPASSGKTQLPPRQRSQSFSPSPSQPSASPTDGAAASPSVDYEGGRLRSESSALKCSHWKPMEQAGKCANPQCRRRFTWKDRRSRSNCCMCGEVFCRPCVKFRRKLSANADPDPLGTFHQVCQACFNYYPSKGAVRDLGGEFRQYRQKHQTKIKQLEQVEQTTPLSQRETSKRKKVALRAETERLTKGYQTHCSMVQNFLSEVRTPDWQKSPHWRPSSQFTHCIHCKKQFRLTNRKIHCRVCGLVFCTNCTKDEIILYLDGEERERETAKWAINGKSGTPTTPPLQFELLPVCVDCSTELQGILVDNIETESPPETVDFLDLLVPMQRELMKYQEKVEEWLPKYQTLVDSLDIEDSSPHSVEGRHPLHQLAKAQCDLSDVFSQLAVKSQNLRGLQSYAKSELRQKMLRHVIFATYQFYSENMYLFRGTRSRLAEFMPLESLSEIQALLDKQSMERVHIALVKVMYEALNLQKRFQFDDSILDLCIHPVKTIENEFKAFLEKRQERWEDHMKFVHEFVESDMRNDPVIKLKNSTLRRQPNPQVYVKQQIVVTFSGLAKSCSRELSAKTSDREFVKTKASLNQTCDKLDALLSDFK